MDDHEGGTDVPPRVLLGEFYGLMQRHRRALHRAFARVDIHPAQAHCLRVLGGCGAVTQSELADAMLLTRPSVTRMLQRMERADLVRRSTDAADQRHTRVELTDAGRAVAARLDAVFAEYTDATLARFSENDRRHLARLLRAWRELADEALATDLDDESSDDADDATRRSTRGSTR